MIMEARQGGYCREMSELVLLNEPALHAVQALDIHAGAANKMPVVLGTTEILVQRVAERYQDVTAAIEHHRLKIDLIEQLWKLQGLYYMI